MNIGRAIPALLAVLVLLTAQTPALSRPDRPADSLADTPPVPSRWVSPDGRPRPRHDLPRRRGPFVAHSVAGPRRALSHPIAAAVPKGRVCLVIADAIYDDIAESLDLYQRDLESEGYNVIAYRLESGTAQSLREFLRGLYEEPASLVGAVLIGDVPFIIYELMQTFSPEEPYEYEDLPCDLFFMDLDGVWEDVVEDGDVHAGNGKYDSHTGDVDLEIWVSRLSAVNLPELGAEGEILRSYLNKNHAYSTDGMSVEARALLYLDDDWAFMAPEDTACAVAVYGSTAAQVVADPNTTTRDDYLSRIASQGYELVHTRSHGNALSHSYLRADGEIEEFVYAEDYRLYDPRVLFYSFYVCSAADYTTQGYLVGTAVFNRSWGLLAWGTTKTGGMWADEPFYQSLASGRCFGDAFLTWWNQARADRPSVAARWWYGMVLIGDATLSLRTFRDVGRAHWAAPHIGACADAGVVSGYDDGCYRSDWPVSRDQMAVFISRALAGGDENVPPGPRTPSFADVPRAHWAYKYVEHCLANDIVQGFDPVTYGPAITVSRDAMAVFISRAVAGRDDSVPDGPAEATFDDVPTGHWAFKYVEYCAAEEIVQGYDPVTYGPTITVSRDQMAVFICRAFGLPM